MYFSLHFTLLIGILMSGEVLSFLIPDRLHSVHTNYGEIIGNIANVQFDGNTRQVRKYLGIPYAEAPIGDLRFEKPVPITNLTSPFMADSLGPICPQNGVSVYNVSEDCLYLNIYVPDSGFSTKLSVMVWIHGGGFIAGMSNLYEGDILSTYTDVIVVTMNYRLAALGFLSTHDSNALGNYGLWDQHLAIKWVKENIASFGGDVQNISIFGESAGSSSVIYQMLYSGNEGLFNRAIAQSGTTAAWGSRNKDSSYKASLDFAVSLGCNSTSHSLLMACLRQKSTDEIISLAVQPTFFNAIQSAWVPVLDGEFVVDEPINILSELSNVNASSKYAHFFDTDLMIGTCNNDGSVYLLYIWQNLLNITGNILAHPELLTQSDIDKLIIPELAEMVLREVPSLAVKDIVKFEYTDWNAPSNAESRIKNTLTMITDAALNAPTTTVADTHVMQNQNTYVYQYATSLTPTYVLGKHVTFHADDVQFVFGLSPSRLDRFGLTNFTSGQVSVSKSTMTMWANFVKTGNPNTPVDVRPLFDLEWEKYGTNKNYLQITPDMTQKSVKSNLAARGVEFWNKLVPKIQSFSKS